VEKVNPARTFRRRFSGGGGKVRLTEATVVGREEGWFLLGDGKGRIYRYPDEESDEVDGA